MLPSIVRNARSVGSLALAPGTAIPPFRARGSAHHHYHLAIASPSVPVLAAHITSINVDFLASAIGVWVARRSLLVHPGDPWGRALATARVCLYGFT